MKILYDTNIVLDIWGKSEFYFDSFVSVDIAQFNRWETLITATMVPDFIYLLSSRKPTSKAGAREQFRSLSQLFHILDVNELDCTNGFESGMKDLEDAIIAHSAYRHNVDFIVTRNLKDYEKSPVPAISPSEFIRLYKPSCLDYGMYDLSNTDQSSK